MLRLLDDRPTQDVVRYLRRGSDQRGVLTGLGYPLRPTSTNLPATANIRSVQQVLLLTKTSSRPGFKSKVLKDHKSTFSPTFLSRRTPYQSVGPKGEGTLGLRGRT